MSEISTIDRYAFLTEWFDTEASLLKKFYLFFFPFDETLELYDVKNRRVFLKRTRCEGISLNELFIGNTVEIFCRQMKIVDHADDMTKKKMLFSMQKTFALIKPDGIDRIGTILRLICNNGFKISKLKMAKVTKDQAMKFYGDRIGQSILPYLLDHITSGPVLAMQIVAENAVNKWRELCGSFDPEIAKKESPNSIRACYGKSKIVNVVHGSESIQAASEAAEIFFPSDPAAVENAPMTSAVFEKSTCCIVKPCAIKEGKLGEIVSLIQECNFEVTAMQMFYMDHSTASEFYEVYKGVVSEYPAMVGHLMSGPCVAMEIIGPMGDETPIEFRKFVGPADPDIARQLRPHTLRARYGKNKIQNAVHVTDLPQDAPLEVQYFFKILSSTS
ncbi:nucleoside diphosphate kinase homolog 7 [Lycorma delicatula]|uniref:nucleoside diphosphate kinase homolog 7 n=1 Tax=Lycorma delicatula TaxID=130591 RepID=UPI003F514024